MKIDYVKLQNFKCHRKLEIPLKNLNILTGSNAAGKSSLIQGLLLAQDAWKGYENKRISTNEIQGLNLGIPSSIVHEEFADKNVILDVGINGKNNEVVLQLLDDEIYFVIQNYEDITAKIAGKEHLGRINLFFLNAERQGPRLITSINNSDSFSVGNSGENTSYVIGEMDKNQKLNENIQLPKKLKISSIDRFSANCEEWLNLITPGTELQHSMDLERNFATIKFKNNGEFYLPTATGFGITYVLPIIVQALAASIIGDAVLIVENPEAHLHPYSQSTLGKFLALVAESGVQVIVETHSEHIVDGCRIQAFKGKQCEKMQVLFFEKKETGSLCRNITVLANGELEEWPEHFFDQKRMDLKELLEMRRCGN